MHPHSVLWIPKIGISADEQGDHFRKLHQNLSWNHRHPILTLSCCATSEQLLVAIPFEPKKQEPEHRYQEIRKHERELRETDEAALSSEPNKKHNNTNKNQARKDMELRRTGLPKKLEKQNQAKMWKRQRCPRKLRLNNRGNCDCREERNDSQMR